MFQELASVQLILEPKKTVALPAWLGRAAQAFFLDALRLINPELSAAVHNGSVMKPFTASSLIGANTDDGTLVIERGKRVELRYTVLHPHLVAVLVNGLIPRWCADGIMLHDQPFHVSAVNIQQHENPWSGVASFASLLEHAKPRRTLHLEFASSTAFKGTDGPFIPLPTPELVFSSLLDRWNRYSPLPLSETLYTQFARGIAIQQLDIATHEVRFGKKHWETISGFTGHVTYRIETVGDNKSASDAVWCSLQALAAFAQYSGVGVKTTTGMGQVRVIL